MLVISLFFGISYIYGKEIAALIRRAETGLTIVVITVGLGALLAFGIDRRRQGLKLKRESELAAVFVPPPADTVNQADSDPQAEGRDRTVEKSRE